MAEAYRGLCTIHRAPARGMITIRADLSDPALAATLEAGGAGAPLPARRRIEAHGERALAWMAPDELMLFLPHAEAGAAADRLTGAFAGMHATAIDVSDARAIFSLAWAAGAREVLAKLTPADMAPGAFGAGDFRRTRLQQVAAAIWMPEAERIEVMCFASVAAHVHGLLTNAARPGAGVHLRPAGG